MFKVKYEGSTPLPPMKIGWDWDLFPWANLDPGHSAFVSAQDRAELKLLRNYLGGGIEAQIIQTGRAYIVRSFSGGQELGVRVWRGLQPAGAEPNSAPLKVQPQ